MVDWRRIESKKRIPNSAQICTRAPSHNNQTYSDDSQLKCHSHFVRVYSEFAHPNSPHLHII